MPRYGAPTNNFLPNVIQTKTAAYTALVNDLVLASASGGAFTVTLPSNPAVGSLVTVQKIDTGSDIVTVDPTGSGTIHGDSVATLESQWAGITVIHQGSDVWMITAQGNSNGVPARLVSIDNLVDFNAVFGSVYTSSDQEFDATSTALPSGWSWLNQGSNTYRERFGAGTLIHDGTAGTWRSIVQSVSGLPSTWDLRAKLSVSSQSISGGIEWGILLTDGTLHRVFERVTASTSSQDQCRLANWATFNTFTSVSGALDLRMGMSSPVYFHLRKNSSTSYDFKVSVDGRAWTNVMSATNPGVTPTNIGISAVSSTAGVEIACEWWRIR